jgi:hypothetical protein
VSRYLVIAMALIAAGFKSTQGAWVEAVGLSGLAAGLTALKLSGGRPAVKSVGYVALAVTALAVAALAMRQWAS